MSTDPKLVKPPTDVRRILTKTGVVCGVAYVVIYLIGANLILNTGLLQRAINRRPEKSLVEWGSGWTVFPGRVHVEGLRVRGQSRRAQWQVRLPAGTIRISLLALARKTVRISRARGEGFEFRIRRRQDPGDEKPAQSRYDPEIEGLQNPPDPAPEAIYPPKKPNRRRWLIDLSDLDFQGPAELWITGLRARGEGRVRGDMTFQLGAEMEVPHGVLDLDDAVVTVDGETIAAGVHLALDARIEPFRPKGTRGLAALKSVFGRLRLSGGKLPDLRALDGLLPEGGGIRALGGAGEIELDITKESAEVGGHGRFSVSVDDARLSLAQQEVSGDLEIDLNLQAGGFSLGWFELGESTISFDDVELPGPKGEDSSWWGRATIDQGRLAFGHPAAVDVVVRVELKDTRPLLHMAFGKPEDAEGEKRKLPRWVRMAPNVKNLDGRASVVLDERGLILDDLVASGDKLDAMARLKIQDGETQGVFYIRYGIFHIGAELSDGKRDIKWTKPRRWFLAQPELEDKRQMVPVDIPDDVEDSTR